MLYSGYLAVSGGGIEAGMPQVFLEETKSVAGVVSLHGMDSEGVSESMRRDIVQYTCLRINQFWQAGFFSAVSDYLPGSVPVNAKD